MPLADGDEVKLVYRLHFPGGAHNTNPAEVDSAMQVAITALTD